MRHNFQFIWQIRPTKQFIIDFIATSLSNSAVKKTSIFMIFSLLIYKIKKKKLLVVTSQGQIAFTIAKCFYTKEIYLEKLCLFSVFYWVLFSGCVDGNLFLLLGTKGVGSHLQAKTIQRSWCESNLHPLCKHHKLSPFDRKKDKK